jgi:hypothetical protein
MSARPIVPFLFGSPNKMPAGTKLVVISESQEAGLPDNVAVFDLNNVIHILFIAYMIYILFESSSFAEKLLLMKMLVLVGLCIFAYHIFVSEDISGCCVRAVETPSELEEEKEILMSTPPSPSKGDEETEEFAELLKDPAVSPPRKTSSPKA